MLSSQKREKTAKRVSPATYLQEIKERDKDPVVPTVLPDDVKA